MARLSFRFTVGHDNVEADGVGSDKVAMASSGLQWERGDIHTDGGFQAKGPLGLMFGIVKGYDVDESKSFGTYSDVRVKARLIFIIMV
ncbi:Leucine-Rich Repeat-Containing G-Protein Coupled Receptor 6 [Manis pentadactyla]|nr:Leucine-Rich Repeat-Containing G-Protein Coupled Receptor 6 [Manis pentadactyla]